MAEIVSKRIIKTISVEFTKEEYEVLVEWLGKTSNNHDAELVGKKGADLLQHIYDTLSKE
jgi:hypothetical protein